MADQQGTQQTKEAITGAVEFLKAATRAGADGFQISDARIVITDHEMRQAVQKAIEGGSQIDDEVADLSPAEGVDVAMHAVSEVRDILS
jgi:phosphosulfolactate synthase (CoM biosynthesis protein A)